MMRDEVGMISHRKRFILWREFRNGKKVLMSDPFPVLSGCQLSQDASEDAACFVVAKALLRLRVQPVVGVGWGAVKRVRENEKSPFPNRNSAMLLALSVAL